MFQQEIIPRFGTDPPFLSSVIYGFLDYMNPLSLLESWDPNKVGKMKNTAQSLNYSLRNLLISVSHCYELLREAGNHRRQL